MNKHAEYLVRKLRLTKHPEGGYFNVTYESSEKIVYDSTTALYNRSSDEQAHFVSTAIYYLLEGKDISVFHRIHKCDEMWHFYSGTPVWLHVIDINGELFANYLGNNIQDNEQPQVLVKAGSWMGAYLNDESSYALLGCTVSPGYNPRDFELGRRDELLTMYPQYEPIIKRLTRSDL
jgi:uncharacterized protein